MNVSGTTAMDPRWHSQLLEILIANPNVAERLTVEVTETVALSNVPSTRQFVESLRKLGCGVAIDDFGAGFTSFRNLRDLPVNMIKLDGSFCQDLRNNNENEYIVRSLIDLAGKFKIKTVAEWIQHEEDADALRSWGIDYLQGNLLGEASIAIPWKANESAVFSLIPDITNEPYVEAVEISAVVTIQDIHEQNELGSPASSVLEIDEAQVSAVIEFQEEDVTIIVNKSNQAESQANPSTDLDFTEIDTSIANLREALSELKTYFPASDSTVQQDAA